MTVQRLFLLILFITDICNAMTPAAVERSIYFAQNSVLLNDARLEIVSAYACHAIASNASQVIVVGHASNTELHARKLAQQRAAKIQSVLIEHGVPATHIYIEGKADRQPIADNASPRGRSLNRRAELDLVGTLGSSACRKVGYDQPTK